jgi:hypothetical protein
VVSETVASRGPPLEITLKGLLKRDEKQIFGILISGPFLGRFPLNSYAPAVQILAIIDGICESEP